MLWSGQTVTASNPFTTLWDDLTAAPADHLIQFPNLNDLLLYGETLFYDIMYTFTPIVQGSFVYWGASSLYSIPALIGGAIHDFTGGLIPNEFLLANNGAEPLSGYTSNVSSILPNLAQGFQYLLHGADGAHGLLGYLDPSTYFGGASAADATTALGSLGDPGALVSDLNSVLPNLGTDLASMLGPELGANASSLVPDLATSLIP